MTLTVLKKNFHELIDTVENKELLDQFYKALAFSALRKEGELWNSLTDTQRKKVLASYKESENKANLINHEQVMKKYSKWLTK